MKIYQLSKINGRYWWTGSIIANQVPEESLDYRWTTDFSIVQTLNGKLIL